MQDIHKKMDNANMLGIFFRVLFETVSFKNFKIFKSFYLLSDRQVLNKSFGAISVSNLEKVGTQIFKIKSLKMIFWMFLDDW